MATRTATAAPTSPITSTRASPTASSWRRVMPIARSAAPSAASVACCRAIAWDNTNSPATAVVSPNRFSATT